MLTVLYDGECVLCRSSKRTIHRLDWRSQIKFLDLHDRETIQRYPQLDFQTLFGALHVVDSNEDVLGGYPAVRRVAKELPLAYPFWLISFFPGMNWLGDRLYRFIARHRYRINKLFGKQAPECDCGACKLPEA